MEAYDGEGNKVWERELDIYGRVKTGRNETGERNFIPFRFQYYSPEEGWQQDPIGLAGGNPTLYGYVFDTLWELDPFGLTWKDLLPGGWGHHLVPRSVAKKLGIEELGRLRSPSWYPEVTEKSGQLYQNLHRSLKEAGIPFHGSKYTGSMEKFWEQAEKAYSGYKEIGELRIRGGETYEDLTPGEALAKLKELQEQGKLPVPKCRK